ncbi:MAG TPA: BatA domain-containing protein, partial [Magnetospirillaceae bacterium]|nr:BatA domain-containing protein [Magnetospirillaceae bacterium]
MLTFTSPWLLLAALALPALWLLLRITPPPPKRFDFPAIRLLLGLSTKNRTAKSAPLWLIILRLTLAALVICGASGPAWKRDRTHADGPWLIVVDNGWAAGKHWTQRRDRVLQMIREADHGGQTVTLLPTAAPADGGPLTLIGPLTPGDARGAAERLEPQAWPGDRIQAAKALDALPHGRAMRVIWVSDGLDDAGASTLAERLETFGQLEIILPAARDLPEMLMAPVSTPTGGTRVRLLRPGGGEAKGQVRALDEQGRSVALIDVDWDKDAHAATAEAEWPSELKNRIARLTIDGEETAAATLLLDGSWSRHPVGLVDDGAPDRVQLLDDLFYGERAVMGFAEARHGSVEELLQRPLSLMILSDRGALPDEERETLRQWVMEGGTLLRFAGPELAGNPDDLLPVRLRSNERLLGSALSWDKAMSLAPMPDNSPFAGLAIPPDLTVSAQILAEPDLSLGEKTWAKLTDGTPLVTGAPLGRGWLVLIHTTAWPGWSNLALSGLFPDMLHRLLDRSVGVAALSTADRPLPLIGQLDGQGHLAPPSAVAQALPAGNQAILPGPRHPPGYYGDAGLRRAVNLAPLLSPPKALGVPQGAARLDLDQSRADLDIGSWLLALALLLLLADLAIAGGLRRAAAPAALLLLALSAPLHAADEIAAALDARLAYVITGDSQVDETSRSGLAALSRQLARRTTAVLAEP